MLSKRTSGWLEEWASSRGTEYTEGLPPREAFEVADALFTVETVKILQHLTETVYNTVENMTGKSHSGAYGSYAIVRTDTQALLGIVSEQYELVQNDALLQMAEFIREEVDMDAVVVLGSGKKVCFTANLRGAAQTSCLVTQWNVASLAT